jgi:hypothetical protein
MVGSSSSPVSEVEPGKVEFSISCITSPSHAHVDGLEGVTADRFEKWPDGSPRGVMQVRLTFGYKGKPDAATYELKRFLHDWVYSHEIPAEGLIRRDAEGYSWIALSSDGTERPYHHIASSAASWPEIACDIARAGSSGSAT